MTIPITSQPKTPAAISASSVIPFSSYRKDLESLVEVSLQGKCLLLDSPQEGESSGLTREVKINFS